MSTDSTVQTDLKSTLASFLEQHGDEIAARWMTLMASAPGGLPSVRGSAPLGPVHWPAALLVTINRLRGMQGASWIHELRNFVDDCHRLELAGEGIAPVFSALERAVADALAQVPAEELPTEELLACLQAELAELRVEISDLESWRLHEKREELESQVHALLEHVSDPILVIELWRGRIRQCNAAAVELIGQPAAKLRSMTLTDLVPSMGGLELKGFVAEVRQEGSATRAGVQVLARDGQQVACDLVGVLTEQQGAPAVLCLLQDARRGASGLLALEERATRLQTELGAQLLEIDRLRTFFENVISALPIMLVVLDSQLRLVHANPAFYVPLGLPRDEIIGRPIDEVLPAELLDAAGLRAALLSVLETGERVRWSGYRDASTRLGERVMNIRLDPCEGRDGERMVLVTLEDITERHTQLYERTVLQQIARALLGQLELPKLLHAILTGMTAGGAVGLGFNRAVLLLVDEEAGVLRAELGVGPENMEQAVKIWREVGQDHRTLEDFLADFDSRPPSERQSLQGLVQKLVFPLSDVEHLPMSAVVAHETVHVQDAEMDPRVRPELRAILETDEFVVAPLVAREKVIGAAIADNRFSQRPIDQGSVSLLTALADMAALAIDTARTFQRAHEHAEQLDKALSDLRAAQDEQLRSAQLAAIGEVAAIVAHEIRGPLSAIGGFARRILREPERAERNARNAEIIVSEVTRLERILGELLDFTRPAKPEFAMVDLAPVILSLAEQARQAQEQEVVEVAVDIEPDTPQVYTDEKQVRQIVLNLINNALQAMPAGGKLTLALRRAHQAVQVLVEDTGEGIPQDRLERIFDAFFTTKPTGTGLGLALCKRLATQLGAELRVESEAGKGTAFVVTLPVAPADGAPVVGS